MQKIKLHVFLVVIAASILAVLVFSSSVSAQSTTWQINGNNVYYTNGKVGIGTRAPTEELDIVGDIKVRGPLDQAGEGGRIHFTTFGRNNNGPKIKSSLVNADGANSQADLILSSYYGRDMDEITLRNGNVGIGTSNPTEKLEVNGQVLVKSGRVNIGGITNSYEKGLSLGVGEDVALIDFVGDKSLLFRADTERAQTVRMAIGSNGNVGIGALTSARHKLEVKGDVLIDKDPAANLYVGGRPNQLENGLRIAAGGENVHVDFKGSGSLDFRADPVDGNKTRMKIHSDGNICIGKC